MSICLVLVSVLIHLLLDLLQESLFGVVRKVVLVSELVYDDLGVFALVNFDLLLVVAVQLYFQHTDGLAVVPSLLLL